MLVAAVISGVVGLVIALLATPLVMRVAPQYLGDSRARDLHHTHKKPIPRLGGLVLALAFLGVQATSWFLRPASLPGSGSLVIILSCLAMFALGFWDDLRPVGARYKLLGQALISLGVWLAGIGVTMFSVPFVGQTGLTSFTSAVLTVLWLVGMTNLINLIDGVDGLAGGICLMLMLLSTYVGFHNPIPALLAAGMTGALVGFLRYNFPPARIYLGDGGAYFLGFQIGLLALVNSQKGTIAAALIAPLFVLALPIVDTALAILRRGLRGLPIFRPDKRHIHHRLLLSGFTRRQVVLSIYTFTAVFMVLGLIAFWSRGKLLPVLVGVAMLILLLCAGNLKFSREWFAVGRVVGNSLEMRQEIRYALAVVRWLELEGARCSSVDELCESFLFCARRFGFTAVRLSLPGVEKEWGEFSSAAEGQMTSIDLPCRIPGKLVLSAPKAAEQAEGTRFVLTIADSSVFEILSELLAEGWIKAANRSHVEPGASLNGESALAYAATGTLPPAASRTRGL